ncbi:MAG: cytochrome c4 [Gammaproteobacteria bacterium]|nr:cytochrome c4 [Gammaproteobacteria bacterium]
MKRLLLVLTMTLPLAAVADTGGADPFTHGDVKAGQQKAGICFACHGPDGSGSVNPAWPKLAGQGSAYIYEQLTQFKSHQRKNPLMEPQAGALSREDMKNLAAYFSSLPYVPGVAGKASIEIAQPLFRAGDPSRGLPACAACHGPDGAGNAAAKIPRLGGQNSAYIAAQLTNFKSRERGVGVNGQMMQYVAGKLSDQEIQALASYVGGLKSGLK